MNVLVFVQKCSGLRLVVRARKRDREPKHNAPKVGMREGERERKTEGKTLYMYIYVHYVPSTRNTLMDTSATTQTLE